MKDDPEFNTYFVHLIEENPCLYDHNHQDYCKREVQDAAWDKIARQAAESVVDCRERWKNIRACYTRYLKTLSDSESGTPGSTKYRKPYYLTEYLRFLKPFTKSRKPKLNISQMYDSQPSFQLQNEENSEEESEGTCKEFIGPDIYQQTPYDSSNQEQLPVFAQLFPKRIKMESTDSVLSEEVNNCQTNAHQTKKSRIEHKSESEDADLLFLKSILPDMKDMNTVQKRKFKIGILNLAGEILNETERSPVPSHPSSTSLSSVSPIQRTMGLNFSA